METVANRIVTLDGANKIARDQTGALMDQLIEGVLTVGSWFAPNDGTSVVVHSTPVASNVFAVAFHVALLKIRSESVHILNEKRSRRTLSEPKNYWLQNL